MIGQRADELPRVRLRAADRPRVEREQRDPDHAAPSRAAPAAAPASARGRRTRGPACASRRAGRGRRAARGRVAASSSAEKPESTTPPPESPNERLRAARRRGHDRQPGAIASAATIPNPSWCDGRTKIVPRRSDGTTDWTAPVASTRSGSGPAGGAPTSSSRASGSSGSASRSRPDVLPRVVRTADEDEHRLVRGSPASRRPARGEAVEVDRDRQDPDRGLVQPARPGDAARAGRRDRRTPCRRRPARARSSRRRTGALTRIASRREARSPWPAPRPLVLEAGADPGGVRAPARGLRRSRSMPMSPPPRRRARRRRRGATRRPAATWLAASNGRRRDGIRP